MKLATVAVPMQRHVRFVADQTVSQEPPPRYEDIASGYETVQVDVPPPYASVLIQAGNDMQ